VLSSEEVVLALKRAGFSARRRGGVTVLQHEHHTVRIPHVALLPYEELAAALRAANLRYTDFLELLSEVPLPPSSSKTRVVVVDDDEELDSSNWLTIGKRSRSA
jgi:hypothetical protein